MTTSEWIKNSTLQLKTTGIETARLDCLVILSDVLAVDKSNLLAYPERILQRSELKLLNTKIDQRLHHIPLAYIRGWAEFYGRDFFVNKNVLVPRPESEAIINLLLRNVDDSMAELIIDVGTGSGCLAITAKLELPHAHVFAVDIEQRCLKVAQKNAHKLGADIAFMQSDLLSTFQESVLQNSIILANLPYVPLKYSVNKATDHEPRVALYSGEDGLDHYRTLFRSSKELHNPPKIVITEALPEQLVLLAEIAKNAGYSVRAEDGLAQLFVNTEK